MSRSLLSAIITALFFQSSPAFSDITWKATVEYMHPYNEEVRKVSGGDWGAGVMGSVEELGIFTTHLKTPDKESIFMPNGSLAGDNLTNFTKNNTRRMDLVIGVSYGEDVREVRKVLLEIVSADSRILKDPEPVVAVLELADSSVNFAVRPWVPTSEYWSIYFDTMEKIKLRLDEMGIEIPFPQSDVHLHQVAEVTAA